MDHERYPYYFDDNVRDQERIGTLIGNAIGSLINAVRRLFSADTPKHV